MQADLLGALSAIDWSKSQIEVLSDRIGKVSPAKQLQMVHALAGAIADRVGREDVEQSTTARLALAVKKLNGLRHQARWEAGAEGPRVIFGRCPYAAVIAQHPELCAMDAALLNELIGRPVQQIAKIGTQGSSRCLFQTDRTIQRT